MPDSLQIDSRYTPMVETAHADRTSRALFALLDLSKALGSQIDLDALLNVTVEKASEVVEAERTSIYVFDAVRGFLRTSHAPGIAPNEIELTLGSGVAGDVARSMRIANVPNAYEDPRFDPQFDRKTGYKTRSILAAPITSSSGQLLGVVQSLNKTTAPAFDMADEALIVAIASHIATAMERARMTVSHLESERLSEALRLASDIQMRMLPGATIAHDNEPFDLYASIRPAKMVGGDLYDFELAANRLYFCIGDVSGKGIGSALIMALTKTLFRANVPYYEDAARLTEAVNLRLCEETGPTMFVTAFCGFLDLEDGTLRFCNAGHDRPFILHADGSVDLLESKPGIALGVMPKFKYPLQQMTFARGDALFLYTDGVTEATDAAEELFSLERVRDVLRQCAREDASNVVAAVTRAVDQFVKNAPQADDITMMCIRYLAADRESFAGTFPRRIDALQDVMKLVETFFVKMSADPTARYAVELALEEIFTNMVKYNTLGKSDIRVDLAIRDHDLVVTLTDFDTPRFDPVAEAPEVDVSRPLDERREGGLGIHLVKRMMDRIEYSHQNRTGTITLRKRLN